MIFSISFIVEYMVHLNSLILILSQKGIYFSVCHPSGGGGKNMSFHWVWGKNEEKRKRGKERKRGKGKGKGEDGREKWEEGREKGQERREKGAGKKPHKKTKLKEQIQKCLKKLIRETLKFTF